MELGLRNSMVIFLLLPFRKMNMICEASFIREITNAINHKNQILFARPHASKEHFLWTLQLNYFFRFWTIFIIKTSFRYRKLHFSFDKFKMLLITKIKCYLYILMLPKHTFSADFTCIIVFVFERLLTLKQV